MKGILTNLLQNAAEAAGPGGSVLAVTTSSADQVAIEVHDSGAGLSAEASATLFQPTITFKKHGMGLGLSIARSHALLSGGDITLVPGELGGAAFRVTLPAAAPSRQDQRAAWRDRRSGPGISKVPASDGDRESGGTKSPGKTIA